MHAIIRRTPSGPATLALGLVGLAASGAAAGVGAQEFHVNRDAERRVVFVSRASLDEFEGVTDRIDGYVLLDGPSLTTDTGGDDTALYLEVDLASIDTGIGLRNRHMRDNYLEVEEHPYATFEGRIDQAQEQAGGFRVIASGTMSIHGVDRPMRIPCDVTPVGRGYRTACEFRLRLSDHDIDIPKVMFMKLAEEVDLRLVFHVRPA